MRRRALYWGLLALPGPALRSLIFGRVREARPFQRYLTTGPFEPQAISAFLKENSIRRAAIRNTAGIQTFGTEVCSIQAFFWIRARVDAMLT